MKKLCVALIITVQAVIFGSGCATVALADTKGGSELISGFVDIEVQNDLITAEIDEASLTQVLKELEKKTGAKWIIKDSSVAGDSLSLEVKQETVEKALKRMLKNYSYVTHFDSRGVVSKVIIYGPKDGQPASAGTTMAYPGSTPQPAKSTAKLSLAEPKLEDESIGDLENSQILTSSQEIKEEASGIGENEDLLDESPPKAAYVPYDLDEFQPLPEEQPDEGIRAVEFDEQDPAAASLAAQSQAEREERRRQARFERALNALNSEHAHLRAMAVDELVVTKDQRATGALESVANSQEAASNERVRATQALWSHAADLEFANSGANAALMRLAEDGDPSVREIANQALRDMERYQRRSGN